MTIEELHAAAKAMIDRLVRERADNTEGKAKALIKTLRDERQFKLLVDVAAAYNATGAYDPAIMVWYAQGLIESGDAAKARGLLTDLAARVPAGSPSYIEARGLLGRAWKQTFFDSPDNSSGPAREAIDHALTEYKACFDAEPGGSVWAGLNLLAVVSFAKRMGIPTAIDIEPRTLALQMLAKLDATPQADRDNWYYASRAEAYLGLGDLDAVEMHLNVFLRSDNSTAFACGGTLRQFTQLWQLDRQGDRGYGIVQAVRAALLKKEGLELSSEQVRESAKAERPANHQLEKILGPGGQAAYQWWTKGAVSAQSVGVISHVTLGKIGTGFLVRGRDFIPALGDELIVITNTHVICEPPLTNGVAFGDALITFEAADAKAYEFSKILWQSPVANCDCALLRLKQQPPGLRPLELSTTIAQIPKDSATHPRVYVIGYPGGRQLTFSFENNELLDHEVPPDGTTPPPPNVCYVQYRAPTEEGSSGSPVFEELTWRVIALHHAGDTAMPKLNGKPGTGPANEGIWIQSIVKAAAAANVQV
jgi:Trypsin-like peptidase domain/Tetratricopeptide Repeats-Sensor